MNNGLRLHGVGEVSFTNQEGERRYIRKTEQHHKLFFKLVNCHPGQQHYKYCTPQALRKESDLWCPFCIYDACGWKAAGKALIPHNELLFMWLLSVHGCSKHWCHQVRKNMWSGPFDFYNYCDKVFVQIDGACHWHGMSSSSAATVLIRDLCCNFSAFNASMGLVRVHESDLQQPQVVLAAIAVASAEHCVVFTSSYMSKAHMHVMQLLKAVHMYCLVRYDAFGNLICNKCYAYLVLMLLSSISIKLVVQPLHVGRPGCELKVHQPVLVCKLYVGCHTNTKVDLAVRLALHFWKVQHITVLQFLFAAPHVHGLVLQ